MFIKQPDMTLETDSCLDRLNDLAYYETLEPLLIVRVS